MTNSDKSKKFPRAGYKIHFDRLRDIRSPVSEIRTHKFKCEIPKEAEEDLKKKFAEISAVVDSSDEGSLIWFLVQLYGLGFLFCNADSDVPSLIKNLYPNNEDSRIINLKDWAKRIENSDKKLLFETCNYEALYKFLNSTSKKKSGTDVDTVS